MAQILPLFMGSYLFSRKQKKLILSERKKGVCDCCHRRAKKIRFISLPP
ncbi:Uncharacterized protein dnm_089970 [Desulfonema magnum]|uniref:Uncharacterized protein n=1 Tax=Desulfonema magnum TaxID=45655 RepID=A0A975BXD8_9BACT|nr:Uncharacterized protein dnm_089970 [Desulfonema magnum]